MKKAFKIFTAVMLIAVLSVVGVGCADGEQMLKPVTPSESTSPTGAVTSAPEKGMIQVSVTDAPPEEEVTSVLVTVSSISIHKAGEGNGEMEQEREQVSLQQQGPILEQDDDHIQVQNQEQEQEQEQENTGNGQQGKQAKGVSGNQSQGNGNKPAEPKGVNSTAVEEEPPETEIGNGAGWITLDIAADTTFDLLKIKGIEELFATGEVDAGKYTQVRLTIDKVEVGLGGEAAEEVKLPSGVLKLVHPFEIVTGETTEILLDFDAEKMVTVTGSGTVIVKPTVKLSVTQQPGIQHEEIKQVSEEESRQIAEEFVKADETFAFDGLEDTFVLTRTDVLRCPYCWSFSFEFDSSAAGYGDRTGLETAQVITHHTAIIAVVQGDVTSAVMDGVWDMIAEEEIETETEDTEITEESSSE